MDAMDEATTSHDAENQAAAEMTVAQRENMQKYQSEIEEVTRQMAEVTAGTHPALIEKVTALQNLKRKRVDVARTYNEHLVENAKGLQEFQKLNAAAAMQTALDALNETLLDTVSQEMRRVEEEVRKAFNKDTAAEETPALATAAALPLPPAAKRLKRPLKHGKHSSAAKDGASGKSAAAVAAAAAAAARAAAPALPASVVLTLSDLEMRQDFTAIIIDLKSRAAAYLDAVNDSQWVQAEISKDTKGAYVLKVGSVTYKLGERIKVKSRTTEEEFIGEITSITSQETFLRLVGNVPTRFHIDHIATGRLTLEKDKRQ